MGIRHILITGLVLVSAVISAAARAHELDLVRILVDDRGPGQYSLLIDGLGGVDQTTGSDVLGWSAACEGVVSRDGRAGGQRLVLTLKCATDAPAFVTLSTGNRGALLAVRHETGTEAPRFLAANAGELVVQLGTKADAPQEWDETARDYLFLGSHHILFGWDHLAFVLCLTLLAGSWSLVLLVTSFTIGHSLSLVAASLGWVNVPIPPVEAVIALSIAFVAREVLRPPSTPRPFRRNSIVVGFGLLHGLGFASALAETGISGTNQLVGLLFFNIGVEAGQLMFVAGMIALLFSIRAGLIRARLTRLLALAAGSLGAFWFVERVVGFWT